MTGLHDQILARLSGLGRARAARGCEMPTLRKPPAHLCGDAA